MFSFFSSIRLIQKLTCIEHRGGVCQAPDALSRQADLRPRRIASRVRLGFFFFFQHTFDFRRDATAALSSQDCVPVHDLAFGV